MAISMQRGEDRILVIRIVFEDTNEPYDLTGWTKVAAHFKSADGSTIIKDSVLVGGEFASAYYEGVTFTADDPGSAGNAIVLAFDGVKTLEDVVDEWNTGNPSLRVTHDSVNETDVLPSSSVTLSGGVNQTRSVSVLSEVLGKLQVTLSSEDTGAFKVGKNLSFKIVVEKGEQRRIVMLHSALHVYDSDVVGY